MHNQVSEFPKAAPVNSPTWQDTRRRMRREVVQFFTANPERRHLCIATGSQTVLRAHRSYGGADSVEGRLARAPTEVTETIATDRGKDISRAIAALLRLVPPYRNDPERVEGLWL